MRNFGQHAAIIVIICSLLLMPMQATSVAREFVIEGGDHAYPLGFDYRPLSGDESPPGLQLVTYNDYKPDGALKEIIHSRLSIELGNQHWTDTPNETTGNRVEMKNAFETLQNMRKDDGRLAHGNISLLSLFDTGEGTLGRQVGIDYLSDRLEDDNQEMPETLAMLLLGTGLIGLARIQRKRMQD